MLSHYIVLSKPIGYVKIDERTLVLNAWEMCDYCSDTGKFSRKHDFFKIIIKSVLYKISSRKGFLYFTIHDASHGIEKRNSWSHIAGSPSDWFLKQ